MPFIDNRLRMLLEQCQIKCARGNLTKAMLDSVVLEALAYKEPAASDIRMLLSGLSPEHTCTAELQMKLNQALRILNMTADYER